MPTRIVKEGGVGDCTEAECTVCCEEYRTGDELRILPCFHSFHAHCIDKWLTSDHPGAANCPVCHTRVELRD